MSPMDICVIMMTSSNGNIFRVTGSLCGEFTGPGEFPTQRPVTRSFDVFFDLRLNKRLSKQPWGWWFETISWSLWRLCNDQASIALKSPLWGCPIYIFTSFMGQPMFALGLICVCCVPRDFLSLKGGPVPKAFFFINFQNIIWRPQPKSTMKSMQV